MGLSGVVRVGGPHSGFFAVPAARDSFFKHFESQFAKLGSASIFVQTISNNFLHSSIIYGSVNFDMFLCLV